MSQPETMEFRDRTGERSFAKGSASATLRLVVAMVLALVACLLFGCATTTGVEGGESASRNGDSAEAAIADGGSSPSEAVGERPPALVVASSYNHVPFESKTGMQPEGFAIDLVKLVGEELGVEVQFTDPVHDAEALPDLLPGDADDVAAKVAAGEATVGLSSIRTSSAPTDAVVLIDPYLTLDLAVVVRADGDIETVEDIANGAAAVQRDGAAASWAAENLPDAEIISYDDPNEALSALVSGRVVASVVDEPVVQRFRQVKAPGRLEVIVSAPTGDDFVMVAADEAQARAINEALAALRTSGAYDELAEVWFGEPSQRGDAGPYTRMPDGQGDTAFSNN